MMNLTQLFKRMTLGWVLAAVPMIGGCGNTFTWAEEVKLLDGRVITVVQKRKTNMATQYDLRAYPVFPCFKQFFVAR